MNLTHNELTKAGEILIVDDTPENLKFLMDVLMKAGYRVRPASDGDLALRSVKAKIPVLILLDIRMPNMDGFEVCRRLKADETTREIPIIFASALSDPAEKVKCFELGAVDYMVKPLNAEEVLMRVANHLSLHVIQQRLEVQNAKLQNVAQYARSLIEASLDPLVTINIEGQITDVNAATERITGVTRHQLIGSDFADYFTEPEKARAGYQQVFLNGSVTDYPLAIRDTSGRIFDVLYNASVYRDKDNSTVLGVFAAARDITERRKTEIQLLQAKEAAEKANVAKSTFISTMSHELRTPLNAILGFSELMSLDETATTKQKETLGIINRSGAHLLSMINDVLDISKIEAGRLELTIQAFDLIKLLQEIGEMINVRAASKQLGFRLELAANVPQFIKADSGKLRQILINLLGNAIKFTAQGEITLHAYTKLVDSVDSIILVIDVMDTGLGIPANKLKELFQPFVQLSPGNEDAKGTGLGLAISKSLIELMGGKINVSSELGSGSIFKIELPAELATATDVAIGENFKTVKSLAPNQPTWRLLVVDDNMENRLLLITLIKEMGLQIREAESGAEAIRLFKEWQPHLIWMDMRMPDMDGYEATRRIRQLAGGDKVKIIALTASAFKEQHESIINAGCDAVLHKPFHIPEIFAALVKYLGVKFVYQDEFAAPAMSTFKISTEMVTALPSTLCQQLHKAALELDIEVTDALISQIRTFAPDVAASLDELAKNYQFEQIIELTEHAANS
jgi:PAS domain S-box-containing protein